MKAIIPMAMGALLLFSYCKKDTVVISTGKTTITFENNVAGQAFALDKDFTIGGKTCKFSAFRYWVSNVVLTSTNGRQFTVPNAYYLIEQTNAQSIQDGTFTYPPTTRTAIELQNIPAGTYKAISFSIGVDKTHNDNLSLQDGELEQMNNMTNVTWMWHTSYIFTTLEGAISDGGTSKNLKVQTGTNDNYVSLSLDLPAPVSVGASQKADIRLSVDVSKVIDGVDVYATPVVSATTPAVMTAVAANYKTKVFSVQTAK
jgi:hypothetical protein